MNGNKILTLSGKQQSNTTRCSLCTILPQTSLKSCSTFCQSWCKTNLTSTWMGTNTCWHMPTYLIAVTYCQHSHHHLMSIEDFLNSVQATNKNGLEMPRLSTITITKEMHYTRSLKVIQENPNMKFAQIEMRSAILIMLRTYTGLGPKSVSTQPSCSYYHKAFKTLVKVRSSFIR